MMSLSYTSLFTVDTGLLIGCTIAETIGAGLGSKIISGLDVVRLRNLIGLSMLATAAMIIFRFFISGMQGGETSGLILWQKCIIVVLFFFLGILNMAGIGSTVPAMAILLLFGLNIHAIYPIVMTGNAISCIFGAFSFIHSGKYSGKAVIASVFGMLAVLLAVHLVQNINVTALQIIMIALMLYSAVSVFRENRRSTIPNSSHS